MKQHKKQQIHDLKVFCILYYTLRALNTVRAILLITQRSPYRFVKGMALSQIILKSTIARIRNLNSVILIIKFQTLSCYYHPPAYWPQALPFADCYHYNKWPIVGYVEFRVVHNTHF